MKSSCQDLDRGNIMRQTSSFSASAGSSHVATDNSTDELPVSEPVRPVHLSGVAGGNGLITDALPSSPSSSSCASRDSSGRSIGEIVDLFLSRIESDEEDSAPSNPDPPARVPPPTVSPLSLTVALRRVRSVPDTKIFEKDAASGGPPQTPRPATVPRAPPGTPRTPMAKSPFCSMNVYGTGCPASPSPVVPYPGSPRSPFRIMDTAGRHHRIMSFTCPENIIEVNDEEEDDPLSYGRATRHFPMLAPNGSDDGSPEASAPLAPKRSVTISNIDSSLKFLTPDLWDSESDSEIENLGLPIGMEANKTPLPVAARKAPSSDGLLLLRRHTLTATDAAVVTPREDDSPSGATPVPYLPTRGAGRELSFTDIGRVVDSDTSDIFVSGDANESGPPSPIIGLAPASRISMRPFAVIDRVPSILIANEVGEWGVRSSESDGFGFRSSGEEGEGDENRPPGTLGRGEMGKGSADWLDALRATPEDLAEAASSKFLRGSGDTGGMPAPGAITSTSSIGLSELPSEVPSGIPIL